MSEYATCEMSMQCDPLTPSLADRIVGNDKWEVVRSKREARLCARLVIAQMVDAMIVGAECRKPTYRTSLQKEKKLFSI